MPVPGFRVFRRIARPDPALAARCAGLSAADIGDNLLTHKTIETARPAPTR